MNDTKLPEKSAKSWKRRKEARPGEILEAALKVFAERGYTATRMDDIATMAGVTKGTIYLYFPSKENVFKSLVSDIVSPKLADFSHQIQVFEGSAYDLLAMLVWAIAEFLQNPERAMLPKIIISESGNFPELADFWRTEFVDKALEMFAAVITRGIKSDEFRNMDPEYLARLCVAPVIIEVIWRTTFGNADQFTFDHQKFLTLHLEVLKNGLGFEGKKS